MGFNFDTILSQPKTSLPGIEPGNVGSAIGAAASFTPVGAVANIASSVVNFVTGLLSFLKGKTQHMDWDTANQKAHEIASALQTQTVQAYGSSKAAKIAKEFTRNMIAYMKTTTRWGEGYPENKQKILNAMIAYPDTEVVDHIGNILWLYSMWALRNTDVNRPDDFSTVFTYDLNQTYTKAVTAIVGTQAAGKLGTPGAPAQEGTSAAASLVSGGKVALYLGVAVILVLVFFGKGKGAIA